MGARRKIRPPTQGENKICYGQEIVKSRNMVWHLHWSLFVSVHNERVHLTILIFESIGYKKNFQLFFKLHINIPRNRVNKMNKIQHVTIYHVTRDDQLVTHTLICTLDLLALKNSIPSKGSRFQRRWIQSTI